MSKKSVKNIGVDKVHLTLIEECTNKILSDDKELIIKGTKIIVLRQTLKKTQGLIEPVYIKNNENYEEKNNNCTSGDDIDDTHKNNQEIS